MAFQASLEYRPETLCSNASPLQSTQRPLCDTSGNANFRAGVDFNFNTAPEPTPSTLDEDLKNLNTSLTDFSHSIYKHVIEQDDGTSTWWWERIPGALTASEQPRYDAYRRRTRKDVAIRAIPPILGKKKVQITLNGVTRQYGRNELLAWKIHQLTGEWRARKQISSHIQVVRNFEDPHSTLSQFLKTDPIKVQSLGSKMVKFDTKEGRLVLVDPLASSHTLGIKMEGSNTQYPPPTHTLGSSALLSPSTIQQIDFNMCVHSPTGRQDAQLNPIIEPWHMCTRVQSQIGAQSKRLAEIDEWRAFFPDLSCCLEEKRSTNCEVLLFEASIDLMQDTPPSGSSVIIEFNVDISCDKDFYDWQIRSTFYEDKGKLESRPPKSLVKGQRMCNHKITVAVPLASKWWVKLFGKAMAQRREVEQREYKKLQDSGHGQCNCDDCKPLYEAMETVLQDEENNCRRYFRETSIMQELFAINPDASHGGSRGERMAIFLWRFRRTRPGETASTTWRKLTEPVLKREGCSRTANSSMLLDPAVQHPDPDSVSDHHPSIYNSTMFDVNFPATWDKHWDDDIRVIYGGSDAGVGFDDSFNQQIEHYPPPHRPQLTPSSSTLSSNEASRSSQPSHMASFSSSVSANINSQDEIYASQYSGRTLGEFREFDRHLDSSRDVASQSSYQYHAMRDYQRMDSEQDNRAESFEFSHIPQNSGHDFSLHSVTDPSLLTDFTGGQIQFSFQDTQSLPAIQPIHCPQYAVTDHQREDPGVPMPDHHPAPILAPQPRHPISVSRLATPDPITHHDGKATSPPSIYSDDSTIVVNHPKHQFSALSPSSNLLAHLTAANEEPELQHQMPPTTPPNTIEEELCGDAFQLQSPAHARIHGEMLTAAHQHQQQSQQHGEHGRDAGFGNLGYAARAVTELEELQDWIFPEAEEGFWEGGRRGEREGFGKGSGGGEDGIKEEEREKEEEEELEVASWGRRRVMEGGEVWD